MRVVLVWLSEKIIEIVCGSVILLVLLGTNSSPRWPGPGGDLILNSSYVVFFMVASGYVFSSFWAAFAWRAYRWRVALKAALFSAHAGVFLFVLGRFDPAIAVRVLLLGATGAALAALAGEGIRRLLKV